MFIKRENKRCYLNFLEMIKESWKKYYQIIRLLNGTKKIFTSMCLRLRKKFLKKKYVFVLDYVKLYDYGGI